MPFALLTRSSFAVAVVLATVLPACRGTSYAPVTHAEPMLIAQAYPPSEVRAAVIRALGTRRFQPEGEEPGRVLARLDRGGTTLRVAVEYSATQVAVRYLSSQGLKTLEGPGGEVLVEDRWLAAAKALRARIGDELLAPVREAAEAARRERDYQLLVERHRTAQAQAAAQAAQAAQAPPAPAPGILLPMPALPAADVSFQQRVMRGSQSITCCINGALYACPSQDAFQKCMTRGPHECTRDASRSCN